MAESQKFEVNFFKPKSEASRANTKVIAILVIIWAVTVFGFQFLLIGVGKPTPEGTLIEFQSLWPEVQDNPTEGELQSFGRILLMTLGKNSTVKESDRAVLREALTVTVNLLDPRAESADAAVEALGLGTEGFDPLLIEQLKYHFAAGDTSTYDDIRGLPEIMELYLTHNRSFLTDTMFLGFPFHYYYTAQFLLILFVLLCLIYARSMDKLNKRLGIEEG